VTSLTVLVPTRNEAESIAALFPRLLATLARLPVSSEILVVDDSDDATPQAVAEQVEQSPPGAVGVRVLHRPPGLRPGGLTGAVFAGAAASCSELIAVLDADLQHPPEVLAALVERLLEDEAADLAVGCRYMPGGDAGGLSPLRHAISLGCRGAAQRRVPASRVTRDPLSGLFLLRRPSMPTRPAAPDAGFKVLLEILAAGAVRRAVDVPYRFQPRAAGASKAGLGEGRRFLRQLRVLHRRRDGAGAPGQLPGRPAVDLEVIIPALNEESRLPATLAALAPALAALPLRSAIVVVDNGSVDRTALVALQAELAVPLSVTGCADPGKGAAVRRGLASSRARWVGFCDADGATDPAALADVVRRLGAGADIVVGSRRLAGSRVEIAQSPWRRIASLAFRRLAGQLAQGHTDTQCGFKFFSADCIPTLLSDPVTDGWAFDLELLARAVRAGLRIEEVPVRWTDSRASRLRLRHGPACLADVARLRRALRPAPVKVDPRPVPIRPDWARSPVSPTEAVGAPAALGASMADAAP
jgi:dolichyl-phosphate beta-glucosyltransferase